MKHFVFILTMPGRSSWNGKWTGDSFIYAKSLAVKNKEAKDLVFSEGNYSYAWDDGWRANVEVKQVTSKEKNEIMKNSKGFAGYDWMVSSIIKHNEIRKPIRRY